MYILRSNSTAEKLTKHQNTMLQSSLSDSDSTFEAIINCFLSNDNVNNFTVVK